MPRVTRSRRNRAAEVPTTSSSSSSALPVPLTTRTLPPRAHRPRSQASSLTTSRSVSLAPGSDSTDHDCEHHSTGGLNLHSGIGMELDEQMQDDPETYDDNEEEEVDELDDSDVESTMTEARPPAQPSELQPQTIPPIQNTTSTPPSLPTPVGGRLDGTHDIMRVDAQSTPTSQPPISADLSNLPGPSVCTTPLTTATSQIHPAISADVSATTVSSPSLQKIMNDINVEPGSSPPPRKRRKINNSPDVEAVDSSPDLVAARKDRGKGKEKAMSPIPATTTSPNTKTPQPPQPEPLSEYTCPICFFPPTNATLTPCGHVCCGACLFTAVKTTLQRGMNAGMAVGVGENVPRCPVCRAPIPGWDGRGGGVIGIKVRQVISL